MGYDAEFRYVVRRNNKGNLFENIRYLAVKSGGAHAWLSDRGKAYECSYNAATNGLEAGETPSF